MPVDHDAEPAQMYPPMQMKTFGLAHGLAGIVLLASAQPLVAQNWLLIEGIAVGEFWATDPSSVALSRNTGDPLLGGELLLWSAVQLHPSLVVYALGEFEGNIEFGENNAEAVAELEAVAVRFAPTPMFVAEAGRIEAVVGTFPQRRFPTRNPLIGIPDGYPTLYPWGVKIGGTIDRFDYRAAIVSLPVVNTRYVPEPKHAPRPVAGIGYSPVPELRIGASATLGPYLNDDIAPFLPAGADWKDYHQRLLAFDLRASTGHFQTYAELAFSEFDVPTSPDAQSGYTYYLEATYAWTSRVFTSARFEQNNYAFVLPVSVDQWVTRTTNFYNGEVGVGYRLGSHTLAKVSYRRDRWPRPIIRPGLEDGYALSMQISHRFDVMSLIRGRP